MAGWRRVSHSLQALAAHTLLFLFTLLLVFKIERIVLCSWWIVFCPLWAFHGVVARGRFSLPAPSVPRNRHWAPCHTVVATPLLVSFELLLCIYLQSLSVVRKPIVNLKVVFIPLLSFEIIILIDNFRMCRALMPSDDENISDEAIWETLPHFWVAISMVFFTAATVFTLLKLSGDVGALGWWDLFINFGIAECFAFLVCTKWSNPMIHRSFRGRVPTSSSSYLDWDGSTVGIEGEEEGETHSSQRCGLEEVGGHLMKIPIIIFQILVCVHLEGTPPSARNLPLVVIFIPIYVVQGAGVVLAASKCVEKLIVVLHSESGSVNDYSFCARAQDCLAFLHHGSRLLGWWSIDEGSREEEARFYQARASGYNTFTGYFPDVVKKMPKRELAEEVWKLQAALGEQTEITKYSQEKFEKLQNDKILCRVCFDREITTVLLPCRHRILCSSCCDKCVNCPICRVTIQERLSVYGV